MIGTPTTPAAFKVKRSLSFQVIREDVLERNELLKHF
jgi:hypothetical protein